MSCVQGGGGLTSLLYVRKKFLFCAYFVIFPYGRYFTILCRRLSLLFYKTFAMIIFLSLKFFTVFFHGIIEWILKNIPDRNGG